MKKLTAILFFILVFTSSGLNAIANNIANVNKVTDAFEQNVDNKEALLEQLANQRKATIGGMSDKQHLNLIAGGDKAEANAQELKGIRAVDLDQAGRDKRSSEEYAFYDENELEPNWQKAGNKKYKDDADAIADATGEILSDLMGKLKEIGIDCKTVKGAIQKEPTYHIDIKRNNQRNTEYDQFFCEEPRNKYNCTDSLNLKCKKRGIKWEKWENKTIEIGGAELVANAKWVFFGRKLKQKHFRLYIDNRKMRNVGFFSQKLRPNPNFEGVKRYFQQLIASKLNVSIEQVSTDDFGVENLDHYVNPYRPAWGGVGCPGLRKKEWIYPTYRIHYRFREGNEICEEWAESRTERCRLK